MQKLVKTLSLIAIIIGLALTALFGYALIGFFTGKYEVTELTAENISANAPETYDYVRLRGARLVLSRAYQDEMPTNGGEPIELDVYVPLDIPGYDGAAVAIFGPKRAENLLPHDADGSLSTESVPFEVYGYITDSANWRPEVKAVMPVLADASVDDIIAIRHGAQPSGIFEIIIKLSFSIGLILVGLAGYRHEISGGGHDTVT